MKTLRRLAFTALVVFGVSAPLSAQYYYFGKNKIAYRPLAWQILKTPSCDIYFDASLSNVAPEAARIAEEACVRLSRLYRIHLTSTIPIVIYGSSAEFANNNISDEILDEGTGGFTEFQKDRVVIPFNGRFEDFHHVLVHELGHAFQLNALTVGNDLSGPVRPPGLWIMEGMAEYGSLGYDSTAELYARDGILTGALPSLMELDNVYGLGYRYYYVYKGGQAFFSYLAETYGEEKVSLFYQKAIRQPDIDKAFKESLGKGMEDVSREWFFYLKKKHFPSVGNRVDPDLRDRRLTSAGRDYSSFNLRPAVGVSNRTLYYISNKRVYAQILEDDLVDDRVVRTVSSADRDAAFESINILNNTLSLNSNRTTLLFSSRSGDTHFFNLYDLKTRRIRERIPMRGFTGVFESALSPDGGRILFSG
ncbi:MAG: hypothetical protein JNM63_16050, partial [Spirochaetia bacterium]|nr:hypothetical protein [Spirochaetia bacterium]